MAFRSLSWMNANPGAIVENKENNSNNIEEDLIIKTRRLLLNLDSCREDCLSNEDIEKAIPNYKYRTN